MSASPNRSSSSVASASAVAARRLEHLARRERHVVEHGHVREQVERLEDDPDPPPDPVDVDAVGRDLLAFDDDPSGVDRLEQVDAAQQRRLARPRRADQADDLVLGDDEVDARAGPRARRTTCAGPRCAGASARHRAAPHGAPRRRRSRATSQSTNRASGIVTTMKTSATPTYGVKLNVAGCSIWAPEDLDDADERHEHRVLLEADEVVEQRRDHPPDGLRHDDVAERLEAATARASAPPPPGSGGSTRCRRGRPRRRRPSRRASGRRSPRRSAGRCARSISPSPGCRSRGRR